jgi:hypothetical protein
VHLSHDHCNPEAISPPHLGCKGEGGGEQAAHRRAVNMAGIQPKPSIQPSKAPAVMLPKLKNAKSNANWLAAMAGVQSAIDTAPPATNRNVFNDPDTKMKPIWTRPLAHIGWSLSIANAITATLTIVRMKMRRAPQR